MASDEEEKEKEGESGLDEEEKEEKKDDKKEGMDAAAMDAKLESFKKSFLRESSEKDALAKKLSVHLGTFDASEKTLQEVAEYGVAKLGLSCPKGSERIALDGFLHNRDANAAKFVVDAAEKKGGKLDAFINSNF